MSLSSLPIDYQKYRRTFNKMNTVFSVIDKIHRQKLLYPKINPDF